ncbi:hypothetical protein ACLESD_40045 [Pyxidicoccus sp. 3LFB2]
MAAKAKKQVKSSARKQMKAQAKAPAKKKKLEVKATRRKTHQKGLVTTDSPEMKAQRKIGDSAKTGVRKTRKQRDVKPTGATDKNPRRGSAKKSVRRSSKPSSATMTPAPADAGMPAGLNAENLS